MKNKEAILSNDLKCKKTIQYYTNNHTYGAFFWGNLSNCKEESLRITINDMFPTQVINNHKYRGAFIGRNSKDKIIDSKYEDIKEFPHPSYNWVGYDIKEGSLLWGTKYVQKLIYEHQFPSDCSDKTFIEYIPWVGGIGSSLVHFARMLGWCIKNGYILGVANYGWEWAKGKFCINDSLYTCFLEPTTNCTKKMAKKSILISNTKMFDITAHLEGCVPNEVKKMLDYSPFGFNGSMSYLTYWEMQGLAFATRFNKRTLNWIKNNMVLDDKWLLNSDLSVHVRHSDKWIEMRLISDKEYMNVINTIQKFVKKPLKIFINTEDNNTIDYFSKSHFDVKYLNHSRSNDVFIFRDRTYIALISFANLYASLRPRMFLRTSQSNWNHLIEALRYTVGGRGNELVFELQRLGSPCLTVAQCQAMNISDIIVNWPAY